MIPSIVIRPSINELQELMIQAGKIMVGVSKGVGQWSGNKKTKVIRIIYKITKHEHHSEDMLFTRGKHIWYCFVLSTCLSSCARLVCFSSGRC